MASNVTGFSGAYNSFSGVDIKAVFGSKVIAELQAISYSITREKAPVYTMGSADPRSFSRGKRGIAGTLIFIMFDRNALLNSMGGANSGLEEIDPNAAVFLSDVDDLRPDFKKNSNIITASAAAEQLRSANQDSTGRTISTPVTNQESELTDVASDQQAALAWYADQILPFDITLAAANEYGALAVMRIYGVEILNEGYGVSIDDIQSAEQMTYVARTVVGWKSLGQHEQFRPNS